nr:hypothetical protein [Tanacetum cinerariifolium]
MACSVPHTYDEIKVTVDKQIEEDKGRQLTIMNLAVEYDNARAAKDDLRKAYEECNDIPQEQRHSPQLVFKKNSWITYVILVKFRCISHIVPSKLVLHVAQARRDESIIGTQKLLITWNPKNGNNHGLKEKLKLSKSQGASTPAEMKHMQNVPHASAVGSIMYAVRCTRPDVAVSCYTDVGYLTDADDLKSQTGYVFILNGGAVDWKSAKQSIFATSSAEAEYIAAFDASKEAVWATPTLLNQHLLKTPQKFPVKRLSFAEQQERRARGLCFNYDEKYHPCHRCSSGEYLILELEEPNLSPPLITEYDFLLDPPYPPLPPPSLVNSNTTPDNIHFHLSADALVGLPSPRTLRLCGIINGHQVFVLVDSGSSHNIIQPRVAKFLQLQISNAPRFSVLVGNGDSLTCSGLCLNVPIYMQQNMFSISFYVLSISGADVVLGVQWLQTLGQILSDYSILVIQFQHDRHLVTLTGEAKVLPTQASFS